jgi:hypothetical protein
VYNGGILYIIASGADIINDKYSTSKNPSTGLYYRLHILKVGVSDETKYGCEAGINGVLQNFYLQLILIGMCNYILVVSNVRGHLLSC